MKKILAFIIILLISQRSYIQGCKYKLLIGTYTNTGKSEGIYAYDIDMKKGNFVQRSVTKDISNPSFLAFSPDKKYMYAVSETDEGSVAKSYSFDKKKNSFTIINSQSTKGGSPCYILATENNVFTANYGGGSISVFGRNGDGSLTEIKQLIRHSGSSINKERQNEPHVHQVIISKDKKHILSNDLGTDNVTVYNYNHLSNNEVLVPFDTLQVKLGSGPRHGVFTKNGKKLYLIQEIDGTVSVLSFDSGKLSLVQETSLVKKDGVINGGADIHLSPDEKFLYATNRGNANDITCFAVANDGKLTFVQQIPTKGNGPRNFVISPDGKYVFIANQYTDDISIFVRNKKTGKLTDSGKSISVGAPVCLLFY